MTIKHRGDVLDVAKELVTGDRQERHGDHNATYDAVATLIDAYLETRKGGALTADDALAINILQKLGRWMHNPNEIDNPVDICGYASLLGENVARRRRDSGVE